MLRDALRLLLFGHRHEDFDRLRERFAVVYRHLGPPIAVGDCFRLFVLIQRDVACDMVVGVT